MHTYMGSHVHTLTHAHRLRQHTGSHTDSHTYVLTHSCTHRLTHTHIQAHAYAHLNPHPRQASGPLAPTRSASHRVWSPMPLSTGHLLRPGPSTRPQVSTVPQHQAPGSPLPCPALNRSLDSSAPSCTLAPAPAGPQQAVAQGTTAVQKGRLCFSSQAELGTLGPRHGALRAAFLRAGSAGCQGRGGSPGSGPHPAVGLAPGGPGLLR